MKTTLSSLDQRLNILCRKVQQERRTVMLGLLTGATVCGVWLTSCQHPKIAKTAVQTHHQAPINQTIPVVPSPAFQPPEQAFFPTKSSTQSTHVQTPSDNNGPEAKPVHTDSTPAKHLVVMKGDTLWTISKKAGVSLAALKRSNGLKNDTIRVGQSLRLP